MFYELILASIYVLLFYIHFTDFPIPTNSDATILFGHPPVRKGKRDVDEGRRESWVYHVDERTSIATCDGSVREPTSGMAMSIAVLERREERREGRGIEERGIEERGIEGRGERGKQTLKVICWRNRRYNFRR